VIKGAKREPPMDKAVRYQRRERGYGEFVRTIVLGEQVEPDRIQAEMEAGVLTVRLPKSQSAKPKQIAIR
jgi:HSP20 family protein